MKTKFALLFAVLAVILSACANSKATPVYALPATAAPAPAMRSLGTVSGATNEQAGAAPAAHARFYDSAKSTASERGRPGPADRHERGLEHCCRRSTEEEDAIYQMAKDLGGYLVSENMSQVYTPSGTAVPQGTISIRVPAESWIMPSARSKRAWWMCRVKTAPARM